MNYEKAIASLEHSEAYRYLLWLVQETREQQIRDASKASSEFEAGKVIGRIDGIDWMLGTLTPPKWLDSPYNED